MGNFIAKRLRFQNGERTSILLRGDTGQPVHEAVLFANRYRVKGKSANTIHLMVANLAFLHRELEARGISLDERLARGDLLTVPETFRLVDKARYRVDDLQEEEPSGRRPSKVVNLERVRMRSQGRQELHPVDPGTHANRLRHFADYLEFRADYAKAELSAAQAKQLAAHVKEVADVLRANVPEVSKRAKLGARTGLSKEEQDRLLDVVRIDSPLNPWKRHYVRLRNWLIVVVLLASGMRRGELLGLQIGDLDPRRPWLKIVRRADASADPRRIQPNTKTYDREIELSPSVMTKLWEYINGDRRAIKEARRHPQVFVSDEGQPLSLKSIDKLFAELRAACPGLPVRLTSHVMRHSWNERFSEQAEKMKLTDQQEQRARAEQQGWSADSKMPGTYTRRHTQRKGREVSLKIQNQLEEKLDGSK